MLTGRTPDKSRNAMVIIPDKAQAALPRVRNFDEIREDMREIESLALSGLIGHDQPPTDASDSFWAQRLLLDRCEDPGLKPAQRSNLLEQLNQFKPCASLAIYYAEALVSSATLQPGNDTHVSLYAFHVAAALSADGFVNSTLAVAVALAAVANATEQLPELMALARVLGASAHDIVQFLELNFNSVAAEVGVQMATELLKKHGATPAAIEATVGSLATTLATELLSIRRVHQRSALDNWKIKSVAYERKQELLLSLRELQNAFSTRNEIVSSLLLRAQERKLYAMPFEIASDGVLIVRQLVALGASTADLRPLIDKLIPQVKTAIPYPRQPRHVWRSRDAAEWATDEDETPEQSDQRRASKRDCDYAHPDDPEYTLLKSDLAFLETAAWSST